MPTTINPSDQVISQYNVQTGGTNNLLNNVAPGASGTVLTSNGAASQPTFQSSTAITTVNVQVFTTSGTYTPTSGMSYCIVELVGGGGGGGGVASTSAITVAAGGGGAGGGYARGLFTASDIGASKSVTIGAGGSGGSTAGGNGSPGNITSLGSLMTAGVGGGGNGSIAVANGFANGGGATNGSGGSFNIYGDAGKWGFCLSTLTGAASGGGGASALGGGGVGSVATVGGPGADGGSYGGGGAGANNYKSQGSGHLGGDGASGICIITEYII